jgi:mycothiol synthase
MCPIGSLHFESGNGDMFDEVAEFYNIVNSFDNPYHINMSGDFFKSSYTYPTIDLVHDIVLVRNSSGMLIGSGTIFSQTTTPPSASIMIQVHPEYRRQGIGSSILDYLIKIGEKQNEVELHCRVFSFRNYATSFVLNRGFVHTHNWIKMQFRHNSRIQPTHLPWNLKIRALNTKKELGLWAQLQNVVFADSPHYEKATVESLKALIDNICFDPNLLIVGEVGDELVGSCMGWSVDSDNAENKEKTLQIQGLSVLPEFRRKGYATSLLQELMNRAFLKGHSKSELLVLSNNIPAMSIYKKIGFEEQYQHQWYTRKI